MSVASSKEKLIKPYTHTTLAKAYGISRKQLYTSLRPLENEIGKRNGYSYSLDQLFTIFEKIGWPSHSIN